MLLHYISISAWERQNHQASVYEPAAGWAKKPTKKQNKNGEKITEGEMKTQGTFLRHSVRGRRRAEPPAAPQPPTREFVQHIRVVVPNLRVRTPPEVHNECEGVTELF